ncbi:MAG: hypothetical protein HYT87_04055 [Nitrospirae bacterium]|nr:hypothetical protein [Nitrospirota bacterium]
MKHIGSFLVWVLLAFAAQAAEPIVVLQAGTSSANPLNWGGDGFLPFPTDFYTVVDPSTPTGLRMQLPEDPIENKLLSRLPMDTTGLREKLREHDGFSPNFPIVISVPAVLKEFDLPKPEDTVKSDSPIQFFRASDAVPLPFRTFLDVILNVGGPNVTVVRIHPLVALRKSERYVVVVRSSFGARADRTIPPSGGFRALMQEKSPADGDLAVAWPRYAGLRSFLKDHQLDPSTLSLAFDFTVESDGSYTRGARRLREAVENHAAEHPLRIKEMQADEERTWWDSAEAVGVHGAFEALDFIDSEGRARPAPVPKNVKFKLLLPRKPREGGIPLAVFGHGLAVNKDTMFQVAGRLVREGIGVIGIDAPYHQHLWSPLKPILGSRSNMDLLAGMFRQYLAQQLMLLQFIRQGLAELDVLPMGEGESKGDGRPDLDVTRTAYIGQSMGGIVGTSVLALDDRLTGGVLNVAGGTLGDVFEEAFLIEEMGLPVFSVKGLSKMESYVAAGLLGYLTDDVDPVGMAPYITRERYLNTHPKLVLVQGGLNDGLVPNAASDRLARALGVPLMEPSAREVSFIEKVQRPYVGPGLAFYRFGQGRFFPHLCLMGDEAASDAVAFLSSLLRPTGDHAFSATSGDPK